MTARTTHFVVYVQDSEAGARDFVMRLERFDQGMRLINGLKEVPSDRANPVTIYVLPDVATINSLCVIGMSRRSCSDVAGFYVGRARGSVAFTPKRAGNGEAWEIAPQTILFHEYAHHFMLSNFAGRFPAWFVEGFAEFNATASLEPDGGISFGKPAIHRFLWLRYGWNISLEKMLTRDVESLKSESDKLSLYARGWLLVHYLNFEASRREQLNRYLRAVAAGSSSLDAARAVFGDLGTLKSELVRYGKAKQLNYVKLAVPALPAGATKVRGLTPGEIALIYFKAIIDRNPHPTVAKFLLADARKAAAPFVVDAGAQAIMAEIELNAGNYDAAVAAADRTLALQPENRRAMCFKGLAQMRRAQAEKSTDPAVWQAVRSWFVKANHAEPDDAWPLALFYASYRAQRIAPTKNAVTGLEAALAAVPQDGALRLMLARQYLEEGRTREARDRLEPLAYDPHAAPDNLAKRLIALVDNGDAAGISAALREIDEEGEQRDSAAGAILDGSEALAGR